MNRRPPHNPVDGIASPLNAPSLVRGPVPHRRMSKRQRWLASLKVGDIVACYFDSNRMQDEVITSAPKSFVSVGKYSKRVNFRRSDGCMCGTKPLGRRFRIERP